mmetsp:Transcript_104297/g.164557  ORF Transcript_104297/g.164557 Transcript_104297/m.164557 type:complete len:231 (-) Transcript_104297:910-1602(-)
MELPLALMNASGMYCTNRKSADKASNCIFRLCSCDHCRWSAGNLLESKYDSKDCTKRQSFATWAHFSLEQHLANVPHNSIRNSISSCEFDKARVPCLLVPLNISAVDRPMDGLVCNNLSRRPLACKVFLQGSVIAWHNNNAIKPVVAKNSLFSTRFEMYIRSTIISFLKILSLKRYPLVKTASIKSRKDSITSACPKASAAPSQSSSRTFQRTSAATRSTSDPNKFTRMT